MNTQPKSGKTPSGNILHYSVGALVEREGKFLLLDRVNPPFGWAGPAGHVDEGEDFETAFARELKEETNLDILSFSLIEERLFDGDDPCPFGVSSHLWRLYRAEVAGELRGEENETKAIGWFSVPEIKKMKLEPVWGFWLKHLKIL